MKRPPIGPQAIAETRIADAVRRLDGAGRAEATELIALDAWRPKRAAATAAVAARADRLLPPT